MVLAELTSLWLAGHDPSLVEALIHLQTDTIRALVKPNRSLLLTGLESQLSETRNLS